MKKNRVLAGILAFQVILELLLPASAVLATGNTIEISSAQEFIQFSENCTLDTWSQNKTVNLTGNIDFSGYNFVPVSTFGGVFNGNGYTLYGISVERKGSYSGVFRYVQASGKVSNLHVKGTLKPTGSKSYIGGIVGENSGVLENCSFEGVMEGENVIGGIAGNNTEMGKIVSATTVGNISGENFTGGIAGKNSGIIQNCTNHAAINTVYTEKKTTVTDIDADTGAIIENYKNTEEENKEESVFGHTDTGGIAGYSNGIIQGCTNHAAIGYQHVGYNVGGIVGRQSGYMLGCKNYGFVQGRKDVGGIAGQAEPYILLNASETTLRDLRTELNTLNRMINQFITDSDNLGENTETHLSSISKHAKNAQSSTENLIDIGTDFVNDNLGEINAQAAIFSNALDKLIPVFDNLENSGSNLTDALEEMSTALSDMKIHAPDLQTEVDEISAALTTISKSEASIKKAITKLNRAKNDLNAAIQFNDDTAVKKALSEMYTAIQEVITAKQNIRNSTEKIEKILRSKPESFEELGIKAKELAENLKIIKESVANGISALQTVSDSLNALITNTEIDFSKFQTAAKNIKSAMEYLEDATYSVTKGLNKLATGLQNFSNGLSDYTDTVAKELNDTKNALSEGITKLSYATDDLKTALHDTKTIITDLSEEKPITFVKLDDNFKTNSQNLFDSLSSISEELNAIRNVFSSGRQTITADLTSVNNQFNLVMHLIMDEFETLANGNYSLEDIFSDASDEDIENTTQGKIADCQNLGKVSADRNTGGIVGALAIEYAKDPEDELEKPTSLHFAYRTKAVVEACINSGNVIGKKDCTGGISGLSEIGSIYKCENYGDTESEKGSYVGGIVGKSNASVRKSYAKCKVAGKRYVGGIAGKANTVAACYSIVTLTGEENTGSICGYADNLDMLYQNFYVPDACGAIDGISYAQKAEPISFSALEKISGIPIRFISFTIIFTADNQIVETQNIKYGDSTSKIRYPKIPKKEDEFGKWPQITAETVTENLEIACEYQPYITVLSSTEKNQTGTLALALTEGTFTDSAELHIVPSDIAPPSNAAGNVEIYDISLINAEIAENTAIPLRILNETKSNIAAWELKNGKWEKIKTKKRGKYVLLSVSDAESTVCLKHRNGITFPWLIGVAVLLAGIAVFIVKRKKKHFNFMFRKNKS